MGKRTYTKPPLSVQEQVDLLKSRGLQINDEPRAARYLRNISYYRLSGYMYPFLKDAKQHTYKDGVVFEDILNLYRFDRELRLLVFSAIEKLEIAMRSHIAYEFSVALQDPFWYTKAANFSDMEKYKSFRKALGTYIKRSKDVFLKHFKNTYSNPLPPIWVVSEILPIGQLSMLYDITAKSSARKAVADYFGVKEVVLISWLHSLAYVRNICAHHVRLWNKDLRIAVKIPKKTVNKWLHAQDLSNHKVYVILAIISYLLDTITPHHSFRQKVKDMVFKHSFIDISVMGFPKCWSADPFWN